MPNIAIIILNYNGGKDILECLDSLRHIRYKHHTVLVVDNKSSDDSVKQVYLYARQYPDQPIEVLELPKNYGYAGGNNRGITRALQKGADYVLILNPDTVVENNFLEELVATAEAYAKEGKEGFFGPRIFLLNAHSTKKHPRVYSNGGLINWLGTRGSLKDYGKGQSRLAEVQPFETEYVSGTCLLASRETIQKAGLMREEYFLYYEDTDWAIRARRQGIVQVIVPQSIIWHKASTTTKEGSPSYIYYHTRNGLYCGWNNAGQFRRWLILAQSGYTFLKQPIKLLIPSKRHWAKPVMRGVLDFWKGKKGKLAT